MGHARPSRPPRQVRSWMLPRSPTSSSATRASWPSGPATRDVDGPHGLALLAVRAGHPGRAHAVRRPGQAAYPVRHRPRALRARPRRAARPTRRARQHLDLDVRGVGDDPTEVDLGRAGNLGHQRGKPAAGQRLGRGQGGSTSLQGRDGGGGAGARVVCRTWLLFLTWPCRSRTMPSSATATPPRWSARTARSTGCACLASTPPPALRGCSATRATGSGSSRPTTSSSRPDGTSTTRPLSRRPSPPPTVEVTLLDVMPTGDNRSTSYGWSPAWRARCGCGTSGWCASTTA